MQFRELRMAPGEALVVPILRAGKASLPGAVGPEEFSAHIDAMVADLERVRAEGIRRLHEQANRPLFPETA